MELAKKLPKRNNIGRSTQTIRSENVSRQD